MFNVKLTSVNEKLRNVKHRSVIFCECETHKCELTTNECDMTMNEYELTAEYEQYRLDGLMKHVPTHDHNSFEAVPGGNHT
jgi:hypothetical protein